MRPDTFVETAARPMDTMVRTTGRPRKTLELPCATCGKPLTLTGWARSNAMRGQRAYCSRACSAAGRRANQLAVRGGLKALEVVCANTTTTYPCPLGGVPFTVVGDQRRNVLRGQRALCSPECRTASRGALLSARSKDPEMRARIATAQRETRARLSPADAAQMAALVAKDGLARIPLRSQSGAVRAHALVDADMVPILSADSWHLDGYGYVRRRDPLTGKRIAIAQGGAP